jgi:hypothetical protein
LQPTLFVRMFIYYNVLWNGARADA